MVLMARWVRKTFSIDKETLSLLENLKRKKRKSYNELLKELSIKEALNHRKKKKKIKEGLLNVVYDLLEE
jgi:hypothetical protein